MRAAVLEEVGQPLVIADDVEIAEPRPGEVRVRVRHCGVCHSDLSVADGSFPSPLPVVAGHEAAGVVEAVGAGVRGLAAGDHVVLTPAPPCGRCYWCARNETSLCQGVVSALFTATLPDGTTPLRRAGAPLYRGLSVGAFAELVVTPEAGAVRIDPDVPLDVACVIGCAVQTGVGAVLNTAGVEAGATVLVLGAGGIGLSVVQGAAVAGASQILVSDPVAARREVAKQLGATELLDPATDDVVAAAFSLTGGIGVDYAFEAAGHAPLLELAIQAIRIGGTAVGVGAPPVDQGITIPGVVGFTATGKKLLGCLLGSVNSHHEIPRLLSLWRTGRLDLERLITGRVPLADINRAFDAMAAREGIRTVVDVS